MEMAVCNENAGLGKKRKKKQKRRGNTTRGDHGGCNPAEDNASTDNTVSQESPKKICLNVNPEMGQSHSEVNLLRENNEKKHDALQCKEASGISVSTILNVKVLKEEDGKSTSPNADFCSADGKENSLVPEEPDGEGSSTIKRDNEHTEAVDHSTPSNHVEIKRIKKRKRRRRMRRSIESPKKSLESNVEAEEEVAVLGNPHEVETMSPLKNFAKEEVMNRVLLDESIDCSISEKAELSANTNESSMVFADPHRSKDCENIPTIKNDKDCLETKDCLDQSNSDGTRGKTKKERKRRRKRRKFADTLEGSLNSGVEDSKKDATLNCLNEVEETSLHEHSTPTKIVKNVLVEEVSIECSVGELPSEMKGREETIHQTVPHLLACDATNDKVGAVIEKKSSSRISNSSNERDATGCSKKKLLILDVNGLLVDFVPYFPDGHTPDIIISRKAVFKRPFCDDFLQFCFERFEVGIWSSRTWKNLNMLVRFLMRDSRHKLLFCWDQSHCTTTRFTTIDNAKKPLLLKELKKIWENLEPNLPWKKGDYDASNTLLLDDSPYKALRNPANTAVFPTTYRYEDSDDTSLVVLTPECLLVMMGGQLLHASKIRLQALEIYLDGPGGDLRTYLEGVSMAENVKKYVEQNPFGQKPISESSPSWKFYRKVINSEE